MRKIRVQTVILILMAGFMLSACSKITDSVSEQKPSQQIRSLAPHMFVFESYTDPMQRDGEFPNQLVVDSQFYENNTISRGDIVYLELPQHVADEIAFGNAGPNISRIVGLPEETLEIKKGQIYIDNALLDTFYAHEYKWAGSQAGKIYETTLEPIEIPKDHYFLMGDNWYRSVIQASIASEYIKGKVIGFME